MCSLIPRKDSCRVLTRAEACAVLQSWCSCRSWLCRWGQSSSGSPGTRPVSGCTGGPCSWVSRRSPRCRSPPKQSCSDSGRRGSRRSPCRTHICDPYSPGPRRRWSGRKVVRAIQTYIKRTARERAERVTWNIWYGGRDLFYFYRLLYRY